MPVIFFVVWDVVNVVVPVMGVVLTVVTFNSEVVSGLTLGVAKIVPVRGELRFVVVPVKPSVDTVVVWVFVVPVVVEMLTVVS